MRGLLVGFVGLAVAGSVSAAEELEKLWTASGLKTPESAIYDKAADAIYVSNVNGDPMQKDGNGFISKLGSDGKVTTLEWVKGLDSPTGLALVDQTLYAADVDTIVAIDVAKGEVKDRFVAEGAKFLNDLTSDKEGRVYASDMMGNKIWMLEDGKLSVLVEDETLENPNGLLAEDGRLLVGSWGKMGEGFATEVPGHMRVVDLKTKKVSDLGDPTPAGNLDGIEPDGKGGYIVSDWMKGALLRVGPDGKAEPLLTLKRGSADLGMIPGKDVVLVPMMMEGELAAYKLD